jgi:hypothetical protein
MTMPDGNSASESRRDADEAAGEELREMYAEKALEDLVWRVMDGRGYPSSGADSTCLDIILREEADAAELSQVVRNALFGDGPVHGYTQLCNGIEEIVKNCLRDSSFHERRIAEMIEEAKDDQI